MHCFRCGGLLSGSECLWQRQIPGELADAVEDMGVDGDHGDLDVLARVDKAWA